MADESAFPNLPAAEAVNFFERKGFEFSFDWRDVWQGEHARAFTVAKAMTVDLLQTIRDAVSDALKEGKTFAEFADELKPELEKRGWWGKRRMVDPKTGEIVNAQLGSPRRLKVIFNTNMRTAYQAGRWERIQRTKQAFPFLRYVSVMDGRERPEHHGWHGTILPVDDPWWDTHYGPCDWGCRCTAQALNLRQIERKGYKVSLEPKSYPLETYINKRTGEVTKIERGIGPGWSYNVGKSYLDALSPKPPALAAGRARLAAPARNAPLTPIQLAALSDYTGSGYAELNAALRADDKQELTRLSAKIKLLDAIFMSRSFGSHAIVYRGFHNDAADAIIANPPRAGSFITYNAYSSTSRNVAKALDFADAGGKTGVVFKIHLTPSANALDVAPYSDNPDEAEVLINRGTPMRVRAWHPETNVLEVEI